MQRETIASPAFPQLSVPAVTIAPMGRGEPLPGLRRARTRKFWRQEDLAQASGVNRSTIGLIEARGKAADIATIRKLAEALEVSADELLRQPE